MDLKLNDIINRCNELKGLLLLIKSGNEPDCDLIKLQAINKANEIANEIANNIEISKPSELSENIIVDNHKDTNIEAIEESKTTECSNDSEYSHIDNFIVESDNIEENIDCNKIVEEEIEVSDIYEPNENKKDDESSEIEIIDDNIEVIDNITDNGKSININEGDSDDVRIPITLDVKIAQQNSKDLKKAFTLNDRFRFKRELFGNSDNDFVDAINLVSAMQSLTEAEEYFYEDLGWDRESDEVQEFMTIIINHFS